MQREYYNRKHHRFTHSNNYSSMQFSFKHMHLYLQYNYEYSLSLRNQDILQTLPFMMKTKRNSYNVTIIRHYYRTQYCHHFQRKEQDSEIPPISGNHFIQKNSDNKEEMARVLPALEYNRLPNYDSERGLP